MLSTSLKCPMKITDWILAYFMVKCLRVFELWHNLQLFLNWIESCNSLLSAWKPRVNNEKLSINLFTLLWNDKVDFKAYVAEILHHKRTSMHMFIWMLSLRRFLFIHVLWGVNGVTVLLKSSGKPMRLAISLAVKYLSFNWRSCFSLSSSESSSRFLNTRSSSTSTQDCRTEPVPST